MIGIMQNRTFDGLINIFNRKRLFDFLLEIQDLALRMASSKREVYSQKKSSAQFDQKQNTLSTSKNNTPSFISNKKLAKNNEDSENDLSSQRPAYGSHPAYKYIGSTAVKKSEFYKFVNLLYHGLVYSVKNLKGPSIEYLNKKAVFLPQKNQQSSKKSLSSNKSISIAKRVDRKKFLMLDLDQTLIHSVFDRKIEAEVKFVKDGNEFRFNVRPYCEVFLDRISEIYDVYVFTASTKDYAEPIVAYLNRNKETIQGVLHRKNCMETMNGFKIKDLRIIKNRPLSQIVLVDNLAHSFGLQIDNGIPILQFINNKQDSELLKLEETLREINEYSDVRNYIQERLNLRKCTTFDEKEFLDLEAWAEEGPLSNQTTKAGNAQESKVLLNIRNS